MNNCSRAGRLIVELAKRYYEQDALIALPRSIATYETFQNAMSLDVAMGGSIAQYCTYWLQRMKPA